MLPYVVSKGLALGPPSSMGLAAIVIVNTGLLFAPAAHGGTLFPGVMPLMVAMLAAALLKEAFTSQKRIGLALIVFGAAGVVWGVVGLAQCRMLVMHYFLAAGFKGTYS